ncbi:MAG: hypothetical protein WA324_11495 [Bryobacteraceae bacterium]
MTSLSPDSWIENLHGKRRNVCWRIQRLDTNRPVESGEALTGNVWAPSVKMSGAESRLSLLCRQMQSFAVPSTSEHATILATRFVIAGTNRESAMDERSPGSGPSARTSEDHLDSWEEIAAYLNRDVTTVQRWEKREGMPVHRHLHDRMGSVYASRAELDSWTLRRNRRSAQASEHTPSQNNPNGSGANGHAVFPDPPAPLPHSLISAPRTTRNVVLLVAAAILAIGIILWLQRTEYFWRNPVANARFQTVTDFDGVEQAAAVSRDGHLIAFLSDRDGPTDIWVTQVGSGLFHNLTHGSVAELVNPFLRNLEFSPDGSLITFWVRKRDDLSSNIGVWAVPTLGGQPQPYLPGAAEFDWSPDSSRLAYHTPGPGDPLFVSNGLKRSDTHLIYTAPPGLHSHFSLWSPDGAFIYFVQGAPPDKWDIWRIPSAGGTPERITSHSARVAYPFLLDRRTMMYLASDPDGPGPWLYSMDVERRIPHRLTPGLDRYTSLAASADGRRLVLTLASPKRTLWRLPIVGSPAEVSAPTRIPLTTNTGFSPRLGRNYLLYVSSTGASESIWKLANGAGTELWSGQGGANLWRPSHLAGWPLHRILCPAV